MFTATDNRESQRLEASCQIPKFRTGDDNVIDSVNHGVLRQHTILRASIAQPDVAQSVGQPSREQLACLT